MEAVGLGVGIAGLFSVCLEVVERVDSYRNFGPHSRQLATRLESIKLRLRRWADSSGVSDGKLATVHHPGLDDPEIAAVVKSILWSICEFFEAAEETRDRLRLPVSQTALHASKWAIPYSSKSSVDKTQFPSPSKTRGLSWAVKGKSRLTEQIEGLEKLVDELFKILPPSVENEYAGSANRRAYKEVDEWLNLLNIDQQRDKDISEHLEGTCEWIFKHPAYANWTSVSEDDNSAKFLWIHGPAGHGKSVLCARIFQEIRAVSEYPYGYLSATGHVQAGGQPDSIIRHWLSQMVRSNRIAYEVVRDRFLSGPHMHNATQAEVWTLFGTVISAVDSCTLIIDGLDEYSRSGETRKSFLRSLKRNVAGTKTRCLIVSRSEIEIEAELNESESDPKKFTMLTCKITPEILRGDIELYSNHIVNEQLPRKNAPLRHELATEMVTRCEGMFLWIRLHKSQLRAGKSRRELRDIVQGMPGGLNQSYDRNWDSIQLLPDNDRHRAILILRWATFALRPLTVGELSNALVIDPDGCRNTISRDALPDELDEDYIDSEVRFLCDSLVEVRSDVSIAPAAWTIHLIHPTVKEYLSSVLPIPIMKGVPLSSGDHNSLQHAFLAKICLCYLNVAIVWRSCEEAPDIQSCQNFREYASLQWIRHLRTSQHLLEVVDDQLRGFFHSGNPNFNAWTNVFEGREADQRLPTSVLSSASMYYASWLGLRHTMEWVHSQGNTNVNAIGHPLGTALQAACWGGHQAAVDLLVEWGADINLHGGLFGSALNAAAAHGDDHMVSYLLKHGANVDHTDLRGWTALHHASAYGDLNSVQFLLEAGSAINPQNEQGRTPLCLSAEDGHLKVTELLVKHGANILQSDNDGWTPLQCAAGRGHSETALFLLSRGAPVSMVSPDGWTVLHMATMGGDLDLVKSLLEHGAEIAQSDEDGWTALLFASFVGHYQTAELLLDKGADILSRNEGGSTALHVAARYGHCETAKLLLDNGAETSSRDKDGWTALHAAARYGHRETVKLLSDKGADIALRDEDGRTPLLYASYEGHREIVELLLDKGADILSRDECGLTALHIAAWHGHCETVELLLKTGADVSSHGDGRTALLWASYRGYRETAQLLINNGADVSSRDEDGWTALSLASYMGHREIVELLSDKGADILSRNKECWTALHAAAYRGHTEVVALLLLRGADSMDVDYTSSTPLHYAIRAGHEKCVEKLVEAGSSLAAVDMFGRSCADWLRLVGSHFQRFSEWTRDQPNQDPEDYQRPHLIKTIRRISLELLPQDQHDSFGMIGGLAHCLNLLGFVEESRFVFQHQITAVDSDGRAIHQVRSCDGCEAGPIKGVRYIYRVCADVDLCQTCMNDGFNSHARLMCKDHDFLEVGMPASGIPPDKTNLLAKLRLWSEMSLDSIPVPDAQPKLSQQAFHPPQLLADDVA